MSLIILILSLSFTNIFSLSKRAEAPAITSISAMLGSFKKIDNLKKSYIEGKINYSTYLNKKNKTAKYISSYIDFNKVVKDALKYDYSAKLKRFKKDHFKGKTLAQQQQFILTFKTLIENITYPIAWEFFDGYKFEHTLIKASAKKTIVKTTIHYKKRPVEIIWILHKVKGKNIVYDISVDDEYWIRSFRSQFNDIINKKSYNKLYKIMKKKLKEVQEDNKIKDTKERKKFLAKQKK